MWGNLHKIPTVQGLGSFQVDEHIHTGRGLHPDSTGTEAPVLGTLPDFTLCIPSSGCSSVSFIIPFNQLVNVFPWVPWVALASESNLKRESPESSFLAKLDRSCGELGDQMLTIGIWSRGAAVLWVGLSLQPGGSDTVSRQRIEGNCKTLGCCREQHQPRVGKPPHVFGDRKC